MTLVLLRVDPKKHLQKELLGCGRVAVGRVKLLPIPYVLMVEPVMLVAEDLIGSRYLAVGNECSHYYHKEQRVEL